MSALLLHGQISFRNYFIKRCFDLNISDMQARIQGVDQGDWSSQPKI